MASKRQAEERARNNERNEYIPSFISKKPFYVGDDTSDADYLEHQRLTQSSKAADSKWYERGKKAAPAATKYRKGACENCGAMTHKVKDCLERPRKKGARWTGMDIQADEVVQDVKMGWDAKRDRWNGFDAEDFARSMEGYRGRLKEEGAEGEEKEGEDGDKYEAETDMGRKQPTSTRNLRIREDTAKYLMNLDLDSAKYDPKTRSMIDAGIKGDKCAEMVADEGFLRASGEAAEFERTQKYAWENQQTNRETPMHLQANPTASVFAEKKEREELATRKAEQKKALLEMYGSQEAVQKKDGVGPTAVEESERFVEYDSRGRIKNKAPAKTKSSYPEDVYVHNHTSVWGSWWSDFKWGYACCHSIVKNSYCTGEYGKKALEEADRLAENEEVPKEIAWKDEEMHQEHVPNESEPDDKAKMNATSGKRTLKEMREGQDDEEFEKYQKRKLAAGDPMAQHLGKDELLA